MKKLHPLRIGFTLLLGLVFAVGCAPAPAAPTVDVLGTMVASTLTAVPLSPTVGPVPGTPVPAPTSASTSTGFTPYFTYTQGQNVNLRVQPGLLFKVSRVMPQQTRLQVLGQAPGGEWLNVLNDEGINGWVGIDFVVGAYDGPALPIITPQDVYLITGTVLDASGKPISGIGFSIVQQTGTKLLRTDAATDASGQFYAYLPKTLSGSWVVGFNSVHCNSNTMDANCNCRDGVCGSPDPGSYTVSLPQNAPLRFTWK